MEEKKVIVKKNRWFRLVVWTILFLLFLPVLLTSLLHVPAVQQWMSGKITGYLSEKMEVNVDLKRIDLSVFKGISLEDFSITTGKADTLLRLSSLDISLSKNIFSLLQNRIEIQSIRLVNPKINTEVDPGDGKLLLVKIFEKLASPKNKQQSSPVKININEFFVQNLDFSVLDERKQSNTIARLSEGKIKFRKFDINSLEFDIEVLNLIRPEYHQLQFGRDAGSPEEPDKNIEDNEDDSDAKNICLQISKLNILDGILNLDKRRHSESSEAYIFNPDHIAFHHITTDIENLSFGGLNDVYASINAVELESSSGFELKKLSIPELIINDQMISLASFNIRTANSVIGNKIILRYNAMSDLSEFTHKVFMDADFANSRISLDELSYFIPAFTRTNFYKKYKSLDLELDGVLKGRMTNVKGSDLTVKLGKAIYFAGNFSARNLPDPDETLLNLKVKNLNTNISFIRDIVPGFSPPKNFLLLGNIDFNGNFDGYLKDFVAFGNLKTDLGKAVLDLKLDVKKGSDQAIYSGNLQLSDFNLGKWSGNKDLGFLDMKTKINNGYSLILKNASVQLESVIQKFEFKNYAYQNIKLNGKLASNFFEGEILSDDPNVDFDFKGSLSLAGKLPMFNFISEVKNINLAALHFTKDSVTVSGKIDIVGEGDNLNNILGQLTGSNVTINKNDTIYQLGNVTFLSERLDGQSKKLDFNSAFINLKLEGIYNLNSVVEDFKTLVKLNFPYHTRNMAVKNPQPVNVQSFRFDAELFDAAKIFTLLGLDDLVVTDFKAKGAVDSEKKEISFVSSLPFLGYKDMKFNNVTLLTNSIASIGSLSVHMDSAVVSGKKLRTLDVSTAINGDETVFDIKASNIVDSVQALDLKGRLIPHPKGYTFEMMDNDIRLFKKRWKISNESKVSFGSNYIDIENFSITDGFRQLELADISNKGLALKLVNLDVGSLNPIINYDKILLGGELNSTIRVNDVFNSSPSLSGTLNIRDVLMNGDSYGELSIDLAKEENKPLEILLSLSRESDGMALKLNGDYDFNTKELDAEVKGKKVSLKFLEYILKTGIKDVKGGVDISADITGKLPKISIDGKGTAYGGQVKVIYLGETYYFDNQNFTITESYIDLTGAKLTDSQGNPGYINGRLNHKLFKDFYLDVGVTGENVIAINTNKFDNPVYYGLGKGRVTVDFSGSVNAPRLLINAVTKPGTVINIPIKESRSASSQSFVTFVDKNKFLNQKRDSLSNEQDVRVEGVSVEMNLTITQDAAVNLIFDEFKNDIIKGVGSGNLRISMSNKGEFDMFGVYTITRGNYLFTALNIVNKPFQVREGGTIRWTGNPINASLNIEADYAVKTPLTSFLTEYLVTDQLKNAAAVSTAVNLKLILGNTLFNPSVKFDFEFPNLTGELKSYTDSKVRLLRNNESDYNSQVFGLIVFNSFIPSNTISDVVTNNNFIQSAGISTLSEFVSSQLSMFVTGIVNEALQDNGLISGIDFDIDLRNTSSFQGVTGNNSLLPTEIEVKLKNKFRFLDERLSVNVGGNYVRQNSLINLNNYIVPEFFIEYALTKDRQLNLKLYGKYDLDEISLTSRRQKFGLGLRYKNEFGSMLQTKTKLAEGFNKLVIKKK